ncbi:hypothetical protein [Cerasicoccus frondis]|uniref:hypothetical protein n=1 Tax=Cerasicoccus frondis TaxID=490090 RepID=UPI0028528051|nr:hypothetical protein [Cerasicoccus frondis]
MIALLWGFFGVVSLSAKSEYFHLKGLLRIDAEYWALIIESDSNRSHLLTQNETITERYRLMQVDVGSKRVQLHDITNNDYFWLAIEEASEASGNSTLDPSSRGSDTSAPAYALGDGKDQSALKIRPFASLSQKAQEKLHDPKFIPMLRSSGIEVPESLEQLAREEAAEEAMNQAALLKQGDGKSNAQRGANGPLVSSAPLVSNAKTEAELQQMRGN